MRNAPIAHVVLSMIEFTTSRTVAGLIPTYTVSNLYFSHPNVFPVKRSPIAVTLVPCISASESTPKGIHGSSSESADHTYIGVTLQLFTSIVLQICRLYVFMGV